MDETPQLPNITGGSPPDSVVPVEPGPLEVEQAAAPAEAESLGVGIPAPPAVELSRVTKGSLWRDAALDLVATLSSTLILGILVVIVAIIFTGIAGISGWITSAWGIVSLLLATELPMLFFAFRRRRRNREKQRPVIALFGSRVGPAISLGIGTGFAMIVLSALYTLGVQRVFGEGSINNQLEFLQNILNDRTGTAVIVLIVAVLAPFCEEIFFRGAIFGSARAAGLNIAGAMISAILFALVHLSLLLAPFYATFAFAMCWLYARTGTLAAPVAAHLTLNGVACLAVIIAGNGSV